MKVIDTVNKTELDLTTDQLVDLVANHNRQVDLIFTVLTTALALWILFRFFSRNLTARRGENQRFLRCFQPLTSWLTRARDRDHRYFPCPGCGTVCRVPRGKGTIRITCPKCGQVMQKKT